ncbi:MAG: hypothetical protein AAFV71_09210 [Cyanobacteria bacterium J06633_8]
MKINTLGFASLLCIYGTFASVLIGAMDTALAQSTVPVSSQSVLNGLYSPRASEMFFEQGKRNIQKETRILLNPELYRREGILKNNIVHSKIIEELEGKNPILNFPKDSLQPE